MTNILESVTKIFSSYLEKNGQRKTSERFAILNEIYQLKGHFDVDSLYLKMQNKEHPISRATLYNTIELLMGCNLITRHQFGKNLAQFEKSFEYKQHDHLICLDCKKVFEFCDPRIQQIQTTTSKMLNFNISHHALNFYGNCGQLKEFEKCEHYKI